MSSPALTSRLARFIRRYLRLKRALGRRYASEGATLAHLDRFLARQKVDLTPETFAVWCGEIGHLRPTVRRSWMRVARNLCLYRQRFESACFIPDPNGFPQPHQPLRPHLFTEEQILGSSVDRWILRKCSTSPLRREVFRLAIVLLYTAGLRRGEIIRLTLADYDPDERSLTVPRANSTSRGSFHCRGMPHASSRPISSHGDGSLTPPKPCFAPVAAACGTIPGKDSPRGSASSSVAPVFGRRPAGSPESTT